MPATSHVCPKCSYENPCFFSEGEIVSLREDRLEEQPSLWTGIVLEVERDKQGNVYRVLWGAPTMDPGTSGAFAAKHGGQHRGEELQRFLVPLIGPPVEFRSGSGGGREGVAYQFAPPRP